MKLNRQRKREIRDAVRGVVACEVRNMDFKNFDDIGESEEENLYIAGFVKDLGDSIDYKGVHAGPEGEGAAGGPQE